jgi:hypothetical protein
LPLDRKIIGLIIVMGITISLVTGFVILSFDLGKNQENSSNSPPTQPVVLISPSLTYNDTPLVCTILIPSKDVDNDTITYTFLWVRNGSKTSIETQTVTSDETQVGDIWQCFVTPFDGAEYGSPGSDTTIIQTREFPIPENTPPSAPSVTIDPEIAYSNDSLTCIISVDSVDIENDSIVYYYEWFRNGSTTGFTGANLSSIHTKTGDTWKCVVTPYDGEDYGPSGNASIVIQDDGIPIPENTLPTAPEVTIGPNPAYSNSTLTCTITVPSTDADNDTITYVYEWYQNGNLTNETSESIQTNQTKVGDEWKCVVTPFDGIEYGATGNDSITIQVREPSGTYSLNPIISFTCAYGMVSLYYSSFTFVDTGTTLTVQPLMNNGGYMTGSTASNGDIDVSFYYSGSCTETYTLKGSFIDENTWQATFTVSFTGYMCFDCYNNQWTIVGTRV